MKLILIPLRSALPLLVVDRIEPEVGPVRHRGVLEVLLPAQRPRHHRVRRPEDRAAQPRGVVRLARGFEHLKAGDFEAVLVASRGQQTLQLLVEPRPEAGHHGGPADDDEAVRQLPPAVHRAGEDGVEDDARHGDAVIVQPPEQLRAALPRDPVNLGSNRL